MKNQTNLTDQYPDLDLSDLDQEPEQQPSEKQLRSMPSKRVKKDNREDNDQQNSDLKKMRGPAFLGGGLFMPPPPPKAPNGNVQELPPQPSKQNSFNVPDFPQRQRKNCIYVENISKALNHNEKLTTVFRTYGSIKNIKVNEEKHSAVIRFHREQDALKFFNSKIKIFNRSYIVYSLNEDVEVPQDKIKQRQRDQNSLVKHEKEVYILKDHQQNLLADKFRCLLFLKNNLFEGQYLDEVERQLQKCRRVRQTKKLEDELLQFLDNSGNPYDWTVSFIRKSSTILEKKNLIQQFKKYGPIGTIDLKPVLHEGTTKPEEEPDKIINIKIKFLGAKASWEMFRELSKELNMRVEGSVLETIYNLWLLQKIPKKQNSSIKEKPETQNNVEEKVEQKNVQQKQSAGNIEKVQQKGNEIEKVVKQGEGEKKEIQ